MDIRFRIPFTDVTVSVNFDLHDVPRHLAAYSVNVVAVALDALSRVCKTFSRDVASGLHMKAKTLKALYVTAQLQPTRAPLPWLTYAKNVTTPDVITRQEDVKAIKLYRDHFLAENPDHMSNNRLAKSRCRGAQYTGICTGAKMVFLKECLTKAFASEEELIKLADTYQNGFPADAAALQAIHKKTRSMHVEAVAAFVQEHNRLQAVYERDLDPNDKEKAQLLTNAFNSGFEERLIEFSKEYIDNENVVNKLYGLRIATQPEKLGEYYFAQASTTENAKTRFNDLPLGFYGVNFTDRKSNGQHTVCYLKYPFGFYFFDANYGLMKAGDMSPADALLDLLHSYKNHNRESLFVYRFDLSSRVAL